MDFHLSPISSTGTNFFISHSIFEEIKHNNIGGSIYLQNGNAYVYYSRFVLCQSFNAAAIFSNNTLLFISFCCFDKLSVNDIGNTKAGTIIDFISSQLTIKFGSNFLCAKAQNQSGDSPFVTRYSTSYLDDINNTKCDSYGGSSVVGLINNSRSEIKRCLIDSCVVDIICELLTNAKSCIFLKNTVIYFGYHGTVFENSFFQGNSNVVDKGDVTYTDCSGEFPGCTQPLSSWTPKLSQVERGVCFNAPCTDTSFQKLRLFSIVCFFALISRLRF